MDDIVGAMLALSIFGTWMANDGAPRMREAADHARAQVLANALDAASIGFTRFISDQAATINIPNHTTAIASTELFLDDSSCCGQSTPLKNYLPVTAVVTGADGNAVTQPDVNGQQMHFCLRQDPSGTVQGLIYTNGTNQASPIDIQRVAALSRYGAGWQWVDGNNVTWIVGNGGTWVWNAADWAGCGPLPGNGYFAVNVRIGTYANSADGVTRSVQRAAATTALLQAFFTLSGAPDGTSLPASTIQTVALGCSSALSGTPVGSGCTASVVASLTEAGGSTRSGQVITNGQATSSSSSQALGPWNGNISASDWSSR